MKLGIVTSGLGGGQKSGSLTLIYVLLLASNAGVWVWALLTFHGNSVLISMALLAYSLGLRHAVDADHIAAIDNVTRKLMQGGKRPITIGLYFSLGHSTIVVLACVAIAALSATFRMQFDGLRDYGSLIGTSISATFLLLIAVANLMTLTRVWRRLRAAKGHVSDFEIPSVPGGFLGRVLRPLITLVSAPWHMYPLGFLFGLGFDTATEIGLLGISATQASQNMPLWSIMIFPALFTAGMSLVDTTDGVIMLRLYGWAFVRPLQKLAYNFSVTLLSVVIALCVGSLEALSLVADRLALHNPFWDWIGGLNDHFGEIGCLIILLFVVCWAISRTINRGHSTTQFDTPST